MKNMPIAPTGRPSTSVRMDLSPAALSRWNPAIVSAKAGDNEIEMFAVIGEDYYGEGITAAKVAAALRNIGDSPVTVSINSPGGDMFEGLAIYNLLREHKGEVSVKVMGLAASAASIIAMAGDKIEIARAGFLMIHNAWVYAVGNRHDMTALAATLEPFDRAMGSIYAARTGLDSGDVAAMMDAETWIAGEDATEQGFADSLLSSDQINEDIKGQSPRIAAHKLDTALARAGVPRSERRKLMNELKAGTPNAAGDDTPRAVILDPLPRLHFPLTAN